MRDLSELFGTVLVPDPPDTVFSVRMPDKSTTWIANTSGVSGPVWVMQLRVASPAGGTFNFVDDSQKRLLLNFQIAPGGSYWWRAVDKSSAFYIPAGCIGNILTSVPKNQYTCQIVFDLAPIQTLDLQPAEAPAEDRAISFTD